VADTSAKPILFGETYQKQCKERQPHLQQYHPYSVLVPALLLLLLLQHTTCWAQWQQLLLHICPMRTST
jgi:hypothetical protein